MSTAPFDPSTFFVPGTDPDRLEYTADDLKGDGADIAEGAADIHTAWGGLASCYSAPEAEMLFSAVDSVPDDAGEVDGALGTAATALTTFAEKARELRREAWALQGDARRFNARVADDEDWAKGTLLGGESEEYQEYTRINSEKIRIQNDFMAAEAECANAIIGLFSARRYTAVNPDGSTRLSGGEIAYGFTEITEELENAWGGPGIGVDHYWFWDVQHAVWDFGGGILENAGGMVGMHGAGGWDFEWSTNLDAHWWGVVEGAGAMVGLYDAEIDHWGFQSWERSREIAWDSAVEAAHAVVPWREWEERPAYVITTALLNVGTIVAGAALTSTGVGAAVGVPLLAYKGLKILDGVGGVPRGLTDALQNLVDSAASGRQGSGSGGLTPVISLTDDTLRALGVDPQRLRTLLTGLEALRDSHTGSPSGDGAADAERPADPTAAELAAGQEFLDGIDPGSRRELEEGLRGAEDAWVASQVPDNASTAYDQRVKVNSGGVEFTARDEITVATSGQGLPGTPVRNPFEDDLVSGGTHDNIPGRANERPYVVENHHFSRPGDSVTIRLADNTIIEINEADGSGHEGTEADAREDSSSSHEGLPESLDSRDDLPHSISQSIPPHILQEIQAAINLVGGVHRFPDSMAVIKFEAGNLPAGVFGRFEPGSQTILFDANSSHLRETFVHEIGHAVDQAGSTATRLGLASNAMPLEPAMRNLLHLARSSPELLDLKRAPKTQFYMYLSTNAEIFARIYSQWITEKTGDSVLREKLELNLSLPGIDKNRQWVDNNFAPLRDAMENLFGEWGLL
ncbi:hypothetical protein ACOQFV_02845 [Nocardiopsis changdeensis]|uniref:Uncharacterized protein n=1 Tax=Nocardiopsis changdeensis TaxID=2831969 RepID=A0ABX8BJZ8_9ACTN|nr:MULTISPECIES: hypothetical protein [Nocardiopsis]QUX22564.1 hypothetical protein KGD84_30420 [Nocardiopsis changdeensis]QYX38505.1 hypothetical protein K1J57_07800 [Nocardiopsis sp. MT53]